MASPGLLKKQSRDQLPRSSSFHQNASSLVGAEACALFDEVTKYEQLLCLPDIDRLSTRRMLSRDSATQIRNLKAVVESMKSQSTKFARIEHLWETRSLLSDPAILNAQASVNLLRQNVIQLHEAVEDFRSGLSQPLPILIRGSMILFDLLEEPRIQADIKAHVHSNTALSTVGSRNLLRSTPFSNVQFRPKLKDVRFDGVALSMLSTCAHFPYSLSTEDVSDNFGGTSLPDRDTAADYVRAITYLRQEYQRQVLLCKKRLEFARQRQYHPVLEVTSRLLGDFRIPDHIQDSEEKCSTQVLREVSRLYSENERRELFVLDGHASRMPLNVRQMLGSSFVVSPPYLLAVPESGFSRERQLLMVSAGLQMKQRFDAWMRFFVTGRRKRAALALQNRVRQAFLRSRFLCWYRYLAARMVSSASSKGRRKSMRRHSISAAADTEASLPMSPHFSKLDSMSGSVPSASVLSFVEHRPATASIEVQVGGRGGALFIRNPASRSRRPR